MVVTQLRTFIENLGTDLGSTIIVEKISNKKGWKIEKLYSLNYTNNQIYFKFSTLNEHSILGIFSNLKK